MSGKQQDESVNLTEQLVVVRAVTPEDMAAVAAGRPRRELSFSGEWEEDPQARFEHAAATGEPVSILIDLGQGQQSYTVVVGVERAGDGFHLTPRAPLVRVASDAKVGADGSTDGTDAKP